MIEIHNVVEQDLNITQDTNLHGMLVGLITVSENANLFLHGMISGDLILKDNSKVAVHGMVTGDVLVKRGTLEVFGMVTGKIIRESGEVFIDPKAVVEEGYFNQENNL
jgi:hypothetical protein